MSRLVPGLDPGGRDPAHWERVRRRIETIAAPELLRRRAAATASVSGLMTAWSQAIVPAAVALAAVGVLFLLAGPGSPAGADAPGGAATQLEVAGPEVASDAAQLTLDGGGRFPIVLEEGRTVVSFVVADGEF